MFLSNKLFYFCSLSGWIQWCWRSFPTLLILWFHFQLALRSVNSSRSAYACVFFSSMFFQHYCWTTVSQPCQKEQQLSLPCKLIIKVPFSELLQQQIHQISSWNYRGWGSAWAPPVSPKQFGEALRAETWDKPGYKPRERIFLLQSCSGSNLCTDFFFFFQSVLPVFRCANVLERNVEKCSISTNPSEHHITFQLLCRHGKGTGEFKPTTFNAVINTGAALSPSAQQDWECSAASVFAKFLNKTHLPHCAGGSGLYYQ